MEKHELPTWASVDPWNLDIKTPYVIKNLVGGVWKQATSTVDLVDPMNGEIFLKVSNANEEELKEVSVNVMKCPKSGMHNPLKNVERYNMYGDVLSNAVVELHKPEAIEFFTKLIQRVTPKSYTQAKGEIMIAKRFFENFCGDNPRFLVKGFMVSGDHFGQQTQGYRFPYGPVLIVSPFNFPLEIPILQLIGCLITGNKPVLKVAHKVCLVMEQMLRMLLHCGMPPTDVEYLNCTGKKIETLVKMTPFRTCQFTGSSNVAEELCQLMHGKVRVEDAGFDWKILGPDVSDIEYVSWTCDQDAYAFGGQKCSAQSIIFSHENWMKAGIVEKIAELAKRRKLEDLTVTPILTWNNKQIEQHIQNCLSIPGAKILFGGKPLQNHKIPECYGSYEPTAVFIPLKEIHENKKHFEIATTELFGPFQVITEYKDNEIDKVIDICERIDQHLTAAVVSNNQNFLDKVLGMTVNGTTYCGIRARTTGAPQNHWFGPSNDPRGAGIGTPEAILLVWTHHREIIKDSGPVPAGWQTPKAT